MSVQSWRLPFIIATSQTPTKLTKYYKFERTGEVGGFGTVTDQGYGISYIVHGEDEGMMIDTFLLFNYILFFQLIFLYTQGKVVLLLTHHTC